MIDIKNKSILLVNDDGIYSTGLLELKKHIENRLPNAEVTVVAPTNQQSGVGRAISLFEPLRITETKLLDGSIGYAVSGTPTDCVILGIYKILNKIPDIVVSGINIGENLGTEITTSGTLGAAFEGAHHGAKALACSLQVLDDHLKFKEGESSYSRFTIPAKITSKVVEQYLKNGFNCDVINLNFPENVKEDTDIKITKLAKKMYSAHIDERTDPRNRSYYWISGDPIIDIDPETDVYTIRTEGKISLTPLTLDTTIKHLDEFKVKYSDNIKHYK